MSKKMNPDTGIEKIEWPTVFLWVGCWMAWVLGLFLLPSILIFLASSVLVFVLVLQSSLSHESLHGHPFKSRALNDGLAILSLGLFIPYLRFRDTHLAHHIDERLTDPYDDLETNFCDPIVWAKMAKWQQLVLRGNNTLLGRMLIGPVISKVMFMRSDWHEMRSGAPAISKTWLLHFVSSIIVVAVVLYSDLPILAYLLSCYFAVLILKIRTFLEHRAHTDIIARTVIIDDKGPLAFLFLTTICTLFIICIPKWLGIIYLSFIAKTRQVMMPSMRGITTRLIVKFPGVIL